MVTRNDLSATAGMRSTRSRAGPISKWPVSNDPRTGEAGRVAVRSREIAEQGGHRHGDRRGIESGVVHLQVPVSRRFSDLRPRTALAFAQDGEIGDAVGVDGEDVALLGFVAPDLERRHAGIVAGDGPQLDRCAPSGAVDQLGKRVGQPPGADVVNGANRVGGAELPAPVDDLLAAALHLRVLALHGREVERFLAAADAPDDAAPPPRPMSIAGPPSTTRRAPGAIASL